jgi:hypothetical protein
MPEHSGLLASLFAHVPDDLLLYFTRIANGSFSGHDEVEVNLLPIAEAVRWTNDFRDFHPLVQTLGGVILDDPNTSNHHIFLSQPVFNGAVLFLDHDGDSRIVFRNLPEFLDAARRSIDDDTELRTYHPKAGILIDDQTGLNRLIEDLYDGKIDGDGTDVILALIPSSNLIADGLFERMAKDDDFYLGEVIGDTIAHRPKPTLESLAMICRNHKHPQASRAGERAMAAIKAIQ